MPIGHLCRCAESRVRRLDPDDDTRPRGRLVKENPRHSKGARGILCIPAPFLARHSATIFLVKYFFFDFIPAGERTYGAMQCASLEAAGASGDAILDAAGHAGM